MEQLKQHFLPMDWEQIENISLPLSGQPDLWAWHYEKSGVFLVRSAYRMLVHTRERRSGWIEHNAGRSDIDADQKEWADLWSIKVPSSCEFFFGGLHGSRSRREMSDTTDTWCRIATVLYAANLTRGGIPC